MFVKIDTKAYFRILTLTTPILHANMAEKVQALLEQNMATPPGNVILVFEAVTAIEPAVAQVIRAAKAEAGEKQVSMVWTGLGRGLRKALCGGEETLAAAVAPTLEEAIDLVMMEQLERDLMEPDSFQEPGEDA